MILNIVTPTRTMLTDHEVTEVIVPAHNGELTILPDHAPLVTQLDTGLLTYKDGQSEVKLVISWGYCEISPNGVRILAETAETKDLVDVDRAKEAVKLAEEKLNAGELGPEDIERYQRKLKRGELRLGL